MNIFEINSCNFGSTGNIMLSIAKTARNAGFRIFTCCPYGRAFLSKRDNFSLFIGNRFARKIHLLARKYLGISECLSIASTYVFLKKIKQLSKEDSGKIIIHLHNLHNSYINLPLLFHFIKKNHIPVIWTLHDCWAFTGRCPYFDLTKCDRWKTGCHDCPYPKNFYPSANIDTTRMMWSLKCKCFSRVENFTIVTPSRWLASLVKQSFLKDYPVKVINNGINLSIFKPTESDFRVQNDLIGKKIVLGVALGWELRKGLDVFIELAKRLPDDYRIVLVGTNENVDKQIPAKIISIHHTQNQMELAEIYTAADVFVNPTREENYPTVNMEAIACGTPVVTFRTGGSPEIPDETCGSVVDCDDIDAMEIEVCRICDEKPYSVEACLKRAKSFDMNDRFDEYVELYKEINKNI